MHPFKMPEITYPLSIDTIGKVIVTAHTVWVHCNTYQCNHRGRLNLVPLVYKLGADHSCMADDLRPHVFCPKCREAGKPDRNISFSIMPLTAPHSEWPKQHFEADVFKRGKR